MAKIRIDKKNGKMDLASRQVMENWYRALPDGCHEIHSKMVAGIHYRATRYKYYFDGLLMLVLPFASKYYKILEDGEPRSVKTTEELHNCLKAKYNPIHALNTLTGELLSNAETTTALSDRDFITKYEQEIMWEFSSPPYNLELPDREEWRAMRLAYEWEDFKVKFFEQFETEFA